MEANDDAGDEHFGLLEKDEPKGCWGQFTGCIGGEYETRRYMTFYYLCATTILTANSCENTLVDVTLGIREIIHFFLSNVFLMQKRDGAP